MSTTTRTGPEPELTSTEPVVRLEQVSVSVREHRILDRIDLSVRQGTCTALLGPSGVGKSTLLRLLTGELEPSAGALQVSSTLRGRRTGPGGARAGVVHQDAHLFGWLTVAENIAVAQRFRANPHDQGRITELVELLGLGELTERWPDQISGGQAQRTALARALAISPDLLLLDEPFSALDPSTRSELQHWLRRAVVDRGLSSVIITHDVDEALILADQIVLFGPGGRVVRRWDSEPAADHHSALAHPLRSRIRAGYADLGRRTREIGDEEWSGYAEEAPRRGPGVPARSDQR